MISHIHQCIFVHVPRTGGTSIENVIWPRARTEADLWRGFIDPIRNKYQTGGLQHLLAHQIRTEVGAEAFGRYFKFSFVRNPWDRVISQYAYMRQRPELRAYIGMQDEGSLVEYLDRISAVEHVQWMPQVAFIRSPQGADLVDFIGRFESLEVDAQRIFRRLGIDRPGLPHRNVSERDRDYRGYFDAHTRSIAARIYAEDIDRFGYSF